MATRRLSGIASSSSVPDNGGDHSGGGGSAGGYVDDVFSTYVYTGTGAAQDIENGVDLAGEGGLVWHKRRDTYQDNYLHDTERGTDLRIISNSTSGNQTIGLSSFNADGFSVTASAYIASGADYVSWTFRKAPKFFDVVTYTGSGTQNRRVPHNLGCRPGLVIVKSIDQSRSWYVWHNSFPDYTGGTTEGSIDGGNVTGHLLLDKDDAYQTRGYFTYVNDDAFGVNYNRSDLNVDGEQYVAYLFAHDDSDESVIKCGTYRGNGAADGPEIDLGFEPQWVMIKSSSGAHGWIMHDTMRGWTSDGKPIARLRADTADAEYTDDNYTEVAVTPTGFRMTDTHPSTNGGGLEYIYMAIRRQNKPAGEFNPEELFGILDNIPANSSNNNTVIPTENEFDVIMAKPDYVGGSSMNVSSRLQGGKAVNTDSTNAEFTSSQFYLDYMKGFRQSIANGEDFLAYTLKRQPGFFDVVCYEGNQIVRDIPHNLGVAPEMMWVKCRGQTRNWMVYAEPATADYSANLNGAGAFFTDSQSWNGTAPTSTHFTVGPSASTNFGAEPMIAYLFASAPGISKVGSYTGTGVAGLDIDCGFTTGARFVLIKRTDAIQSWNFWDTVRGITTGNDPKLTLEDASGQYSGANYLNPLPSGFTVDTNGTDLNADGGEYLFYAIA